MKEVNNMKQTIIVMVNNWLFNINRVLAHNNIDLRKVISIHADYVELTNETHITIYTIE